MAVNRNRAVVMGSTSIRRELLDKPRLLFAFRIFILVVCIVRFSLLFFSIEIVRVFSLLSILFENCDF